MKIKQFGAESDTFADLLNQVSVFLNSIKQNLNIVCVTQYSANGKFYYYMQYQEIPRLGVMGRT